MAASASVRSDWALAPFASAEVIRDHPRFPEAVDLLIDDVADLYGDDRRLVRTLFEYNRAITFMVAICVAAAHDPARPETWLTLTSLRTALARMGITDPRRIRRLVDELRGEGLIDELPMPGDLRRLWLAPTERMLAIDREWLATFHAPLALLAPEEPRYQRALARDRNYQRTYRRASVETLDLANGVVRQNPPIDFFLHQSVGFRIMALLLRVARASPDGWTPDGFYTSAAQCSATSRVHVRNVIRAAADRELVGARAWPKRPCQRWPGSARSRRAVGRREPIRHRPGFNDSDRFGAKISLEPLAPAFPVVAINILATVDFAGRGPMSGPANFGCPTLPGCPCRLILDQFVAVLGGQIEPVGLAEVPDQAHRLLTKGLLAFEAVQQDALEQIAQTDFVVGGNRLQELEDSPLNANAGLHARNLLPDRFRQDANSPLQVKCLGMRSDRARQAGLRLPPKEPQRTGMLRKDSISRSHSAGLSSWGKCPASAITVDQQFGRSR